MRWKRRGIPGKMQSLPSKRTTGYMRTFNTGETTSTCGRYETHHPDVGRDKQRLCIGREERHAFARGALLGGLVREVGAVLDELGHSAQCLCVVLERLVESLRKRRVRDVCPYHRKQCGVSASK